MKIALVCSSGGHLLELYSLKDFWKFFERFWVTFNGSDSSVILKDEKVFYAYAPTNRNIRNLFRNLLLAVKILLKENPDVVVSTGAGVGVPFLFIGKTFGKKTIYIELITRIKDLSLAGKLVYPLVDILLVQWPELAEKYKKAKFVGQVI